MGKDGVIYPRVPFARQDYLGEVSNAYKVVRKTRNEGNCKEIARSEKHKSLTFLFHNHDKKPTPMNQAESPHLVKVHFIHVEKHCLDRCSGKSTYIASS